MQHAGGATGSAAQHHGQGQAQTSVLYVEQGVQCEPEPAALAEAEGQAAEPSLGADDGSCVPSDALALLGEAPGRRRVGDVRGPCQ